MTKIKLLAGIALMTMAFSACDDTTDTLGNSLTNNSDRFEIVTDTFLIQPTRSIVVDSVLSRSQYSYLGNIKDYETGSYVTSNYTTQFAIQESLGGGDMLPPLDSIRSLDANNKVIADSCKIRLYFNSSVGDSLNPMKLTAYEMSKPIEEGKLYYTNFDPEKEGLLRNDGKGIRKNKVYTPVDLNQSDSLRALVVDKTNMEMVTIPLNEKYYGADGKEYSNYGTYLLRMYYEHPEYYKNSYNFIHNVCPGFYIKSTDGLGVMSEVYLTELNIYYRYTENDSTIKNVQVLSGTEEVLQTTNITNDKSTIQRLADDNTCTYLKTPAGIFTEVTLPVDEIKYNHENDTISSAKIVFNRINPTSADDGIYEPKSVLMIPKDSLYNFFANKDLPDYKTSYLATYNSSYNTYTFNNISSLISSMYQIKKQNKHSDDWNKVVLVPVSISYNTSSSSTSITNVSNDMSLKSTRLVGGSANSHKPISISVIYNKFVKD